MLSSYISGRVGVFIDEANLFHSQRTLGWRIDYQKLYWMLRDLDLATKNIFIYTSFLQSNKKQISFIDKLVEYGYFVHSKKVKEIEDKSGLVLRKGNLDIELALDAYRFSNLYDTLVLLSGDSDFAYLLDLVKEDNKRVVVISTRRHVSVELLDRAHSYLDIKKLRFFIEKLGDDHKTAQTGGLGGTTLTSIAK